MKVVVALSGGVDSALSAALLKEQGHEVVGMFMKNWSPRMEQSLTDCPWEQDQADAEAVCAHLGIPFRSINFERPYEERVVTPLVEGYAAGITPNPDVLCNEQIKFDIFLDEALKMGANMMATGHYARIEQGRVLRGVDRTKDQSYFIYRMSERACCHTLFPIGSMPKSDVRLEAQRRGLPVAAKKDSQGICFIGHLDLKQFLIDELGERPGWVRLLPPYREGEDLESRKRRALPIGKHRGLFTMTIGERLGSVVDNALYRVQRGHESVKPVYVISKNQDEVIAYATDDSSDPHLYAQELHVQSVVVTGNGPSSLVERCASGCDVQARYQQPPIPAASVEDIGDGIVRVRLVEPVRAAAPGQAIVFYRGQELLGGGVLCATA
jgi:tRNA-specific 2-thiouridylase